MSEFISFIKVVLCNMPSAFSHRENFYQILDKEKNNIDPELLELYKSVYEDLEMSKLSYDKHNMNKDFVLFRTDFKKAIQQYKEEKVDGQAEQAH